MIFEGKDKRQLVTFAWYLLVIPFHRALSPFTPSSDTSDISDAVPDSGYVRCLQSLVFSLLHVRGLLSQVTLARREVGANDGVTTFM